MRYALFALVGSALLTSPSLFAQSGNADAAPAELPQHLVKVLRTSNKAQTNRYVPVVYDFENVNPYSVSRQLRRVLDLEEGAYFAFMAPDGKSGKVLLALPEYQIPGIEEVIGYIDRADMTSSGGTQRNYVHLRHRDATDVGLVFSARLEGTPTIGVTADPRNNAVLLEDARSGLDRATNAVLEFYDLPTPQLEAVVTVYEVDVSDDGQLGLDYVAWKNGPGRNLFAIGAFANKEKITTFDGNSSALLYNSGRNTHNLPGREWHATGRNGAFFYDMPSAYFDFLVSKGRARIMTESKLVALNNETATLQVSDDILYYQEKHNPDLRAGARVRPLDPYGDFEAQIDTNSGNETTDQLGVNVADHPDNRVVVPSTLGRSLGVASAGFFLRYTPIIGQVASEIALQMSVVNHTGYADDGVPTLASRDIDTTFTINHDERELTIGGLVRQRRIDSANRMPWLGDIPVLGALFGGESRLDQKTQVFVTFKCKVAKFGESNVTNADAETREKATGARGFDVPANDPGFLSQ